MKKNIVENCFILSMTDIQRSGLLNPDYHSLPVVKWDFGCGLKLAVLIRVKPALNWIKLPYQYQNRKVRYSVGLDFSNCYFGGQRIWFKSQACFQRVRNLYKLLQSKYFGCRHCYDLGYFSRQSSAQNQKFISLGFKDHIFLNRYNVFHTLDYI